MKRLINIQNEDKVVYPVHLCDQSFKDCLELLLIFNHYVYIKGFNRLLKDHGGDGLLINGGQKVKLEKGFIEFKNYNRQIPIPFKIYADFKCLLKNVDSGIDNDCFSYTSKYQDHVPCSFAYKLVYINDKFSIDIVLYRGKDAVFKFIQHIFKEYDYCRGVRRKHFNNNLVMTAEQNEEFERTNICWICGKLIDIDENKVRDHDHTKKDNNYRGAAHTST